MNNYEDIITYICIHTLDIDGIMRIKLSGEELDNLYEY